MDIIVFILAVGLSSVKGSSFPSGSVGNTTLCPPFESRTVQVTCHLDGVAANCTEEWSAPGTLAHFGCKPLHEFLFGFLPAGGYWSRCGQDGAWSVRPFSCVPTCGRPTGKATALVRGGTTVAEAADYPWHVVVYDVTKKEAERQVCGGTLISTRFFVSAAHCFYLEKQKLPETLYQVAVGKTKRLMQEENYSQFRDVQKIHLFEDFRGVEFHYTNDIALVELEEEVNITPWVLPACVDWELDLPDLQPEEHGTIVGFGNTLTPLVDLHSVSLPVQRRSTCRQHAPHDLSFYTTQPDKYCVGFTNGSTVGKGDSGGGMTFPSEDRKWYLRGVVSVGSLASVSYSFFTNVTMFVPWMAKLIKRGEVSGRQCGVDDASVVDGQEAGRADFPWELDVYYRQAPSRGFHRLWSGVLVSPHLVVTTTTQIPPEGLHIDISVYPPAWFRVASRRNTDSLDLSDASNVSEVVRLFHPDDMLLKHGVQFNFILLELKEPMHLMPLCLDWSGSALLHLQKGGTTFHERGNNTRIWKQYVILNEGECRERLDEPLVVSEPICRQSHESPHEILERGMQIYNPTTTYGGCGFKSKPISSLDAYNFCTVQEGFDPPSPSRSLLVNVDNVWFLRGVLSFSTIVNNNSVAMYTDFSDAQVQRWLTKTRDLVGKPTCGDVSLCSALSPDQSVLGHMPWTVAVRVNGVERGSGLLIQPNAVITDSSLFQVGEYGDVRAPPSNISILWQSTEGDTKTSRVLHVSVHDTKGYPDVALLELDPDTPALNTPVCLDLSGSVLRPLATGQLGLVESWSSWGPSNHSLVGGRGIDYFECYQKFARTSIPYSKNSGFCTSSESSILDPHVLGGGYLVSSGSKWFIQGLFSKYLELRRGNILVATDFNNEGLRLWLRKKLDKIKLLPWHIPGNSAPKNCEGGKPSSPRECGVFVAQHENNGGGGGGDDYLDKRTLNRMQWNVNVYVDHGEGDMRVRSGTVVHRKMVLTSALRLLNFDDASPDGIPTVIPSRNITVRYSTADSRNTLVVDVTEVHVRRRTEKSWSDHYRYDMALLVVEEPVQIMPVCVPALGSLGAAIPRLVPGTKGLVEVWEHPETNYWHLLVPARVKSEKDCRDILPDVGSDVNVTIPADEFCAQYLEADAETLPADYGASFSVQTAGFWFLRGVVGIDWRFHGGTGVQRTVFVFHNLDDPALLQWLHDMIHNRTNEDPLSPEEEATSEPSVPTLSFEPASGDDEFTNYRYVGPDDPPPGELEFSSTSRAEPTPTSTKRCVSDMEFLCKDGSDCIYAPYRCDGHKGCRDGSDEEGCDSVSTVSLPLNATMTARVQYLDRHAFVNVHLCGSEHCSLLRLVGETDTGDLDYVQYTKCDRYGQRCTRLSPPKNFRSFPSGEMVLEIHRRADELAVWRKEHPDDVVVVPVEADYGTLRIRPHHWSADMPVEFTLNSSPSVEVKPEFNEPAAHSPSPPIFPTVPSTEVPTHDFNPFDPYRYGPVDFSPPVQLKPSSTGRPVLPTSTESTSTKAQPEFSSTAQQEAPSTKLPTTKRCRTDMEFLCNDGKKCLLGYQRCDGSRHCRDGSDEEGCDIVSTVALPLNATMTARVQYLKQHMFIDVHLCGTERCSLLRLLGVNQRGRLVSIEHTGCNRYGQRCFSRGETQDPGTFPPGEVVLEMQRRTDELAVWRKGHPDDVAVVPVEVDYSTLRVWPYLWSADMPVQFTLNSSPSENVNPAFLKPPPYSPSPPIFPEVSTTEAAKKAFDPYRYGPVDLSAPVQVDSTSTSWPVRLSSSESTSAKASTASAEKHTTPAPRPTTFFERTTSKPTSFSTSAPDDGGFDGYRYGPVDVSPPRQLITSTTKQLKNPPTTERPTTKTWPRPLRPISTTLAPNIQPAPSMSSSSLTRSRSVKCGTPSSFQCTRLRCIDGAARCNGVLDTGCNGADERDCDALPTIPLPLNGAVRARVQFHREHRDIEVHLCGGAHAAQCSSVVLAGFGKHGWLTAASQSDCNHQGQYCTGLYKIQVYGVEKTTTIPFSDGEIVLEAQHRPGELAVWIEGRPEDTITVPVEEDYTTLRIRPSFWGSDMPVEFTEVSVAPLIDDDGNDDNGDDDEENDSSTSSNAEQEDGSATISVLKIAALWLGVALTVVTVALLVLLTAVISAWLSGRGRAAAPTTTAP